MGPRPRDPEDELRMARVAFAAATGRTPEEITRDEIAASSKGIEGWAAAALANRLLRLSDALSAP